MVTWAPSRSAAAGRTEAHPKRHPVVALLGVRGVVGLRCGAAGVRADLQQVLPGLHRAGGDLAHRGPPSERLGEGPHAVAVVDHPLAVTTEGGVQPRVDVPRCGVVGGERLRGAGAGAHDGVVGVAPRGVVGRAHQEGRVGVLAAVDRLVTGAPVGEASGVAGAGVGVGVAREPLERRRAPPRSGNTERSHLSPT